MGNYKASVSEAGIFLLTSSYGSVKSTRRMNSLIFYLLPLGSLPLPFFSLSSGNKSMLQKLLKVYGRRAPTFWESSPRTVLLSWRDHAVVHWHAPRWEAPLHRLARRDQHGLLERRLDHILWVIPHWDLNGEEKRMTTCIPNEFIQRTAQASQIRTL